jgi:DNA-directed RNA polymerase subunit RPC12/RpoP
MRRVREVLEIASRPSGAVKQHLLRVAEDNAGEWGRGWRGAGDAKEYAREIVQQLTELKAVQPVLDTRCSTCGLAVRLRPADIADVVMCTNCEAEILLASRVLDHVEWRFTTRPLLSTNRLRASHPTLSALSAILDVLRGPGSSLFTTALDVEGLTGAPFEVDFVLYVQDGPDPVLVIGESKARGQSIEVEDIDHLERLQDAVRSAGLECLIGVAVSRTELGDDEAARLRASCERGLVFETAKSGVGTLPNLPIILTKDMLTVPTFSEGHPTMLSGGRTYSALPALAQETCRLKLGLK